MYLRPRLTVILVPMPGVLGLAYLRSTKCSAAQRPLSHLPPCVGLTGAADAGAKQSTTRRGPATRDFAAAFFSLRPRRAEPGTAAAAQAPAISIAPRPARWLDTLLAMPWSHAMSLTPPGPVSRVGPITPHPRARLPLSTPPATGAARADEENTQEPPTRQPPSWRGRLKTHYGIAAAFLVLLAGVALGSSDPASGPLAIIAVSVLIGLTLNALISQRTQNLRQFTNLAWPIAWSLMS